MASNDQLDYHTRSLLQLAKSLGSLRPTPSDKVEYLKSLCPVYGNQGEAVNLSTRDQSAVIALGVYLLESGLQYCAEILDILLEVLISLPTAKFSNGFAGANKFNLPGIECFSFCLNTILSDVAFRAPHHKDLIVNKQIQVLKHLTQTCRNLNNADLVTNQQVPLLLGVVRSLGRCSSEDCPLISHLFSVRQPPISQRCSPGPETPQPQPFNTFRSILPSSRSTIFIHLGADSGATVGAGDGKLSRRSTCLNMSSSSLDTILSDHSTRKTSTISVSSLPCSIYFNKVASSFTQTRPLAEINTDEECLKFKEEKLKHILQCVTAFLSSKKFFFIKVIKKALGV
ncbi:phosphatidylinositol 4-kinase alpha-like [Physella acuta]|uniref:phosphatidylinositol 4-kinase alpha-like n=1 Tax=Physella acuta TaxID=109671 RepID=UPI0027DCB4F1|nr:phosphatidylinositol 4-kinase alpha-like [Physella acuta]